MSDDPPGRWWVAHLKEGSVSLALSVALACLASAALWWRPEDWWLWAAAGHAGLLVVVAAAAPVVLLPLFSEVRPLTRAPLARRLLTLAARAGVGVSGVWEWRAGARSRRANAAMAGVGPTRRLLVSDTLLADCSDDEIEVVLVHELGHHVRHDLWSTLALEAVVGLAACYAADRALMHWSGSAGLTGKADVAALPIVALAAAAVVLASRPVGNALSRVQERRADRVALDLTGNADGFIRATSRLTARNLADPSPSRLTEVCFPTHPPAAERIEAARVWAARAERGPTTGPPARRAGRAFGRAARRW